MNGSQKYVHRIARITAGLTLALGGAGLLFASAASAAPESPSPTTSTQVGDWASAGCIPVTWDTGAAFNAWALDNYTMTFHSNQGFLTQGGTFSAYCDPTTGLGFIGMNKPLVSGTFSGRMQWVDITNWGNWGNFTYYGANGWVMTEQWNFTQQKEGGVPATTPYSQTENFYLG